MNRKLLTAVLAVLAFSCIGLAAAQTVSLPQEETFTVGNDTEALRVSAENVSVNESGYNTLQVDVIGIDSDGNRTTVASGEVNTTGAGTTADVYRFEAINSSKYPRFALNVTGAGVEWLELEKLEAFSGGGGALLPQGSIGGVSYTRAGAVGLVVLLIVLGGAWMVLRS